MARYVGPARRYAGPVAVAASGAVANQVFQGGARYVGRVISRGASRAADYAQRQIGQYFRRQKRGRNDPDPPARKTRRVDKPSGLKTEHHLQSMPKRFTSRGPPRRRRFRTKRRRKYRKRKVQHHYYTAGSRSLTINQGKIAWTEDFSWIESQIQTVKTALINAYLAENAPAGASTNTRFWLGKRQSKHMIRNANNVPVFMDVFQWICRRDCNQSPRAMMADNWQDTMIQSNTLTINDNIFHTPIRGSIKKFWKLQKRTRVQFAPGETKFFTLINKKPFLYDEAKRDDVMGSGQRTSFIAGLTQVLTYKIVGSPTHELGDPQANPPVPEDPDKVSTTSGAMDDVWWKHISVIPIVQMAHYNQMVSTIPTDLVEEAAMADHDEVPVDD